MIGAHPEYQRIVADADSAVGFRAECRGCRARIRFYIWGCIWRFANKSPSTGPRESAICSANCRRAMGMRIVRSTRSWRALGEELWTAQRDGRAPDEKRYLALARNRLDAS